jgi:2-methylcitrate dehydratase PrpD
VAKQMTNIGQELSRIIERVSYKDLPEAVVYHIKQTFLDSIGCALGARVIDRGRIALELVNEIGRQPASGNYWRRS